MTFAGTHIASTFEAERPHLEDPAAEAAGTLDPGL